MEPNSTKSAVANVPNSKVAVDASVAIPQRRPFGAGLTAYGATLPRIFLPGLSGTSVQYPYCGTTGG
jgi:hypothetical protein